MDYHSKNYRVWFPVQRWERPFTGRMEEFHLQTIFKLRCPYDYRWLKCIIGMKFLHPKSRRLLYPSNSLSIFISNLLDMLQCLDSVIVIAEKMVNDIFLQNDALVEWAQKYVFGMGEGYVGGIFLPHFLPHNRAFVKVYDTFK